MLVRQSVADFTRPVARLLDDLDELDGCCFHEGGQIDNGDFRVELAVSADPAGYEVRATLIDNRTRRAIKRFVTWRGRT